MKTDGVGGGITGWRGDLILVDDPHPTWADAYSATHRARVREWFNGTLYDRQEPGATICVLMHRWHAEDLAGYLIGEHADRWQALVLPALAQPGDVLGRPEGAPLCPARFPRHSLLQIQAGTPKPVWAAKYQQNPLGVGTGRLYGSYTPADNNRKGLGLRDDLPLDVSFDFNRNPGMHAVIGQADNRADELYAAHEVHGPYMKLPACLDAISRIINAYGGFRWPQLRVFGDATGTQDRAETTATAYQQIIRWAAAAAYPYKLYVPPRNPPVRDRIDAFNEALKDNGGTVHYFVDALECPRLAYDLAYMRADEQGLEDKTDEKMSHASSAEGYRVNRLRPIKAPRRGGGRVLFSGGG